MWSNNWAIYGDEFGNASDVAWGGIYLGNGIFVVGTQYGDIFRSTDSGLTWTRVREGSDYGTGTYHFCKAFLDLGSGEVVTACGTVFLISHDYGATWLQTGTLPDGFIGAMVNLGGGHLQAYSFYETTGGYYYDSVDSGSNWSTRTRISPTVYGESWCGEYLGNDTVFAGMGKGLGTSKGVYVSTDAGYNWSIKPFGNGTDGRFATCSLKLSAAGSAIVQVRNDTTYVEELWRTTDYGANWSLVFANDAFYDEQYGRLLFQTSDGRVWFFSSLRIFISDNGGASFTLLENYGVNGYVIAGGNKVADDLRVVVAGGPNFLFADIPVSAIIDDYSRVGRRRRAMREARRL